MKHPIIYGVYLVKFPFLEKETSKIRPVIVIGPAVGEFGVTAIVPISSKLDSELQSVDFTLDNWEECGLIKPSVVRVHRLATIAQENLDTYLGNLTSRDIETLKQRLAQLLDI